MDQLQFFIRTKKNKTKDIFQWANELGNIHLGTPMEILKFKGNIPKTKKVVFGLIITKMVKKKLKADM